MWGKGLVENVIRAEERLVENVRIPSYGEKSLKLFIKPSYDI